MEWRLALSFPRMVACTVLQGLYNPKTAIVRNSLDGKLAVVSGGNSGIGLETVKSLALQGCEVIILCRSPQRASDAMNEVNNECKSAGSGGFCRSLALDLADLVSVGACVKVLRDEFEAKTSGKRIDFLVCNGGIMVQPYSTSPQGYEIHYATNHLGHFALVGGIMDILQEHRTRIVIITGDIAVCSDDATPVFEYEGTSLDAYCRSKILNQSMTMELNRRYGETNAVFAVHPGVINSHLVEESSGIVGFIEHRVRPWFMITPEMGAQSTLTCLLTTSVPPGSYFHNVFGVTNYHPTAANTLWTQAKWEESAQLCTSHGILLKYN